MSPDRDRQPSNLQREDPGARVHRLLPEVAGYAGGQDGEGGEDAAGRKGEVL